MVRVENVSTPRASPKPDFGADGAPAGRARVGTGSQGPAPTPRPPTRVQTGSRLPSAPSPTIYQKDLTTKEEPGRKRGGRGEPKSSKSFRGRGRTLLLPPFSFCEFLEVTPPPRIRSGRYQSPDSSHIGTGIHTHFRTQIQVHGGTRSASPLPSQRPE